MSFVLCICIFHLFIEFVCCFCYDFQNRLRRAHCRAATDLQLQRQLLLPFKSLRCPRDHVMLQTALIPRTMQPATE